MFWRWHAVQCKSMSYGQEGAPWYAISELVVGIIIACFKHFQPRVLSFNRGLIFLCMMLVLVPVFSVEMCFARDILTVATWTASRVAFRRVVTLARLTSLFYDVTSSVLNLFYLCTVVNVYFCLLCRDLQGNNLTSVRRRDFQGLRNLRILWVALSHKTFAYHVPLLQPKTLDIK